MKVNVASLREGLATFLYAVLGFVTLTMGILSGQLGSQFIRCVDGFAADKALANIGSRQGLVHGTIL